VGCPAPTAAHPDERLMTRAALLLVLFAVAGCSSGGGPALAKVAVAADSLACGCAKGSGLVVVNHCPVTIVASVIGDDAASAEGSAADVTITSVGTPTAPGTDVLHTATTVRGGGISFSWSPEVSAAAVRTDYELSLSLRSSSSTSLMPMVLLDPRAGPYLLCAYWADAHGTMASSTIPYPGGTDVQLVARLTGDVSGDPFFVSMQVVTGDHLESSFGSPLPAELRSDLLQATSSWSLPADSSVDAFYFDATLALVSDPAVVDTTVSGPLHLRR